MADKQESAALRDRLLGAERALPTSRLERLLRTGRAGAGLATAMLGRRFQRRGDDIDPADLEDITRLVARLGELKGVAMKAGQILGYVDTTLPDEVKALLAVLQTASPASPFEAVEATLRGAFGPRAERLIAAMDRAPVAAASIGQVHRARIDDVDLAIKVRHPGIEEALRSDFGAASVGVVFARAFVPAGGESVRGLVEEAQTAMLEECDLALEASRQEAFGRHLRGHPVLVVPRVERAWCAPSVLATRWTPGLSLDDWLASGPPQAARDRAGAALFELYVGMLYRHGAFHADPHPGNYAFAADGRVIVYDFGCVRSFDAQTVKALSRLSLAAASDDRAEMESAFVALGASPPASAAARENLHTLVRGFFAPLGRGRHRVAPDARREAREVLRDKRALVSLSLPGKLLFLLRIRFGLYAVLARMGAEADWGALEAGWAASSGASLSPSGDSLPPRAFA